MPPIDLPEPVAAALDAANAADTDRFLAAFTPAGVVNDWGRVFTGPAEIRRWSDREFIGVSVHLDVTASITTGPTTAVQAQVGGFGFTGPSQFTFTVDGDRISLMRITA